jgi:SH3-like domain-containing protein
MFREIVGHCLQNKQKKAFPAFGVALSIGLLLGVLTAGSGTAFALEAGPKPQPEQIVGPATGLPVPRFVSLKSNRINVRRGPGSDNEILWVFRKKGLPVEITAESGRWRRIRDQEGETGWVWHSMLDGRRGAIVTGLSGDDAPVPLFAEPAQSSQVLAYAEKGVVARLPFCQDQWCELEINGYDGWVLRDMLWGTYQGENFE